MRKDASGVRAASQARIIAVTGRTSVLFFNNLYSHSVRKDLRACNYRPEVFFTHVTYGYVPARAGNDTAMYANSG